MYYGAAALFNSGLERLSDEAYEVFVKSVLGIDIGFDLHGYFSGDLAKAKKTNEGAVQPQPGIVSTPGARPSPVDLSDNLLDLQTPPKNLDADLRRLPGYGKDPYVSAAAHAMYFTRRWGAYKNAYAEAGMKMPAEATALYQSEPTTYDKASKHGSTKMGSKAGQTIPTSRSFIHGVAELVQQVDTQRRSGLINRRQAMNVLYTMKEPNTHNKDKRSASWTTPENTADYLNSAQPRSGPKGDKETVDIRDANIIARGAGEGGAELANPSRPVEYADRANMMIAGLHRIKDRFKKFGIPDGTAGHQGHPALARFDEKPLRAYAGRNPRDLLVDQDTPVNVRSDESELQRRTSVRTYDTPDGKPPMPKLFERKEGASRGGPVRDVGKDVTESGKAASAWRNDPERYYAAQGATVTGVAKPGYTRQQVVDAAQARRERKSGRYQQGANVSGFDGHGMSASGDDAVMGGVTMPKFEEGFTLAATKFAEEVGTPKMRAKGLKFSNQMSREVGREKKSKAIDRMTQGEW